MRTEYSTDIIDKDIIDDFITEDVTYYSVTESYDIWRDISYMRENINTIDWDLVSVELDHFDIDVLREFRKKIKWELLDPETYMDWKENNDRRYVEFKKELENNERESFDRDIIQYFAKPLFN